MAVTLNIVEKTSGNLALDLATYTITEAGFPTGVILNAADIAAWELSDTTIRASLNSKSADLFAAQGEEYALLNDKLDVPKELTDLIAALTLEVADLTGQLEALGERPTPVELFVNKYSEVLQYFDNTGAITPEGITWAKSIPFFGRLLGDFLAD